MSQLVLAIIAFVLFSVITDFLEGVKKKRNQKTPPAEPNATIGTGAKESDRNRDTGVLAPQRQTGRRDPKRPAAARVASKYAAADAKAQANQPKPTESEREAKILKPTDIHSEVLLNAVAYAQILQPPKAYQYMATKSCRGEWNNQK